MRASSKLIALALAAAFAASAAAAPARAQAALPSKLAAAMRSAGAYSGAYVYNATDGRPVFRWRPGAARILASNTKLFTTAAALARFGVDGTLATEVLGRARLTEDGVWRGNLWLRGGGDPTFGSRSFTSRAYGGGSTVQDLAALIEEAGVARVAGRILGDESRFDSLRGGPESGYGTSIWVGPLSALSFNRGLADERGRSFQTDPARFAAARLDAALGRRGIGVRRAPSSGAAPDDAELLASLDSPPMGTLSRLANKPSDNFFAETLTKGLALRATGRGTTRAGARVAARFAGRLGARARLVDGSGLSRANRASPGAVVKLLLAMLRRDEARAFRASLAVAGRDGTLADRMRRGPARGRCRGKTGTLSNVSALSGYCRARSGDLYAFSLLMNGVYTPGARALQDRMAQAIAGVRE